MNTFYFSDLSNGLMLMKGFSSDLLLAQQQRHWPAFLLLEFEKGENKTRMSEMKFKGPLRVQRPLYPEGQVCHVYLLHPPGGLVSGDDLNIKLNGLQRFFGTVTRFNPSFINTT